MGIAGPTTPQAVAHTPTGVAAAWALDFCATPGAADSDAAHPCPLFRDAPLNLGLHLFGQARLHLSFHYRVVAPALQFNLDEIQSGGHGQAVCNLGTLHSWL